MKNDTALQLTRLQHSHNCRVAHKSTVKGHAPTVECALHGGTCSSAVLTVRSVRRQKNRPGEVKVTWTNALGQGQGASWVADPEA
jgi:hypothetical protein